jgi:hypothetical protein
VRALAQALLVLVSVSLRQEEALVRWRALLVVHRVLLGLLLAQDQQVVVLPPSELRRMNRPLRMRLN